MTDNNKDVIGGGSLFNDYQRPPPRASTALGLMPTNKSAAAATNNESTSGGIPTDFSKVIGGTVKVSDDVRASPQYAEWYYAQNPRDPRTPVPLIKGGKYGAAVARAPTSQAGDSISAVPQNNTVPIHQPPTAASNATAPAPTTGAKSKYQPPSQRASGGANAGPAIPLSKAPASIPLSKAPVAAQGGKGGSKAPVADTKVVKPPIAPASGATPSTTNTAPINPLLAGLGRVSKAPSSIPDGEERWTDELVEETISPPKPAANAGGKSNLPPTPPKAVTTTGGPTVVSSGGQQFSLYARPFEPPKHPQVDLTAAGAGLYNPMGVMDDTANDDSQYYAAMRSIVPDYGNQMVGGGFGAMQPTATGFQQFQQPQQHGAFQPAPTAQGFTPYPQYNYGNSPSKVLEAGMYDQQGGAMMGEAGYEGNWYAGGGAELYGDNQMMDYGYGRGMGGNRGGRGGQQRNQRGGFLNNTPTMMGGGGRGGRGGMPGQQTSPQRSAFVEKFHAEHTQGNWRLTDVEGHVAEIAKDQEGSRFVQVQLDAAAHNGTLVKQLDEVLDELFSDPVTATDVVCDVFGNYVVQKILDVANEAQLAKIFGHLRGIIVNLTLQTYGCRVIQKAVEALRKYPALLEGVVQELEPNVPRCVQDQNGNHVIQKLVEINPDGAGFIIDAFRGKVKELATHAYGCRVIQCILSQCPRYEPDIMRELFVCLPELTMDQYGNYVVQHILQHGPQRYVDICFEALKNRIYYCSRQKFASNVIEKLFLRCSREQRQEFFDILCYCDPDVGVTEQTSQQIAGRPLLSYFVLMMMDPFANYVVQKFVDEADENLRRQMMAHTMQYLDVLKAHHYGMHIVNRFERSKYIPQTSGGAAPQQQHTDMYADHNAHNSGRGGGRGNRGGRGGGRGRGAPRGL